MMLSPNFLLSEFEDHRAGVQPQPDAIVVKLHLLCTLALQPVRDKFGPVSITSGYRLPVTNAQVGGATRSRHLYTSHGLLSPAADFKAATGTPVEWAALLEQLLAPYAGIGTYASHVHVDLRALRARWQG